MSCECENPMYSVEDYLLNKVKFDVPVAALIPILIDRGMDAASVAVDTDRDQLRLAYADLLKWYLLGASKVNNISDSDNGWTHTGGGYELTDADREDMKSEANAIYAELEPTSTFGKKVSFRMRSHGVKRANTELCGRPLPRIDN